jgi:hypothetical protein
MMMENAMVGQVARLEELRNAYKFLVGKPLRKRPVGRLFVDERIILEWILGKWVENEWIEFV